MTLTGISALTIARAGGRGSATARVEKGRAEPPALKAARLLESMFVRQLVRALGKDSAAGSLFGKSLGQSVYQEMFQGAVADKIYEAGGLGLASQLVAQLGGQAPHGAASSGGGSVARLLAALPRALSAADGLATTGASAPRRGASDFAAALRAQRGRRVVAPKTAGAADAKTASAGPAALRSGHDLAGVRYAAPNRRSFALPKDSDGRLAAPLAGGARQRGPTGRFVATAGERVRAAASGRVARVLGDGILLEHSAGRQTLYRGLGTVSAQVGDLVLRGQEIGRVGSDETLFFGVKKDSTWLEQGRIDALFR